MIRIIAFIIAFLPALAAADCMDFTEKLIKNDYAVTISDQEFVLSFAVESMVDCPRGIATLTYDLEEDGWTKSFEIDMDFESTSEWVEIIGFGYCFLSDSKLVIIPIDAPMLIMKKQSSTIFFPWPE